MIEQWNHGGSGERGGAIARGIIIPGAIILGVGGGGDQLLLISLKNNDIYEL